MARAAKRSRLRWPLPPRFTLFLVVMPAAMALLAVAGMRWGQAVLAGFDLAALVFIASLGDLRRDYTVEQMRQRARINDTSRLGVLLITVLMVLVIITAVIVDLPAARKATGLAHAWSLAMVLASLVIAWVFANLIIALHYAHMYYRDDREGGMNFPQLEDRDNDGLDDRAGITVHPVFDDFVYFSLTIGMAFATSDVEVARRDIRNLVTLHGIAAFFYNLVVLAFTINVTASG